LSEKSKSVGSSQSRTDTLIGADLRVEGNITSTGVLRIQGDVQGDVSCDADSGGTIVVDKSGNITGAIKAPHIVVSGHVAGPLHSLESIEIQEGACVVGDAFYKEIDIQAGGVLEGTLTPRGLPDGPGAPLPDPVAAGSRQGMRFAGWPRFGAAFALLVAVFAVVLLNRNPAPVAPAATEVANVAAAPQGVPAAQVAPAANSASQDSPKAAAADAVSLAPGAEANVKAGAQDSPPETSEVGKDKVVKVQGVNPGKPAGFFLLIGKEPSVLFKKRRQEEGDGTRIDVAQGATVSVPIAKNEIFRVAEGRDIEIFYQGRKVAPKTIESGAWMSFVPQLPDGARGRSN
jgi:cytoskeletal protein CcmA (bactofilin family)